MSLLRRPMVMLLALMATSATSCKYSDPEWVLLQRQSLISRDVTKFVIIAQASLVRKPEGFVAQFPDGGSWQVDEEKIYAWQFETKDLSYSLLAEINRPKEIRSGLHFFGEGWDQDGAFYISLGGNRGKTSDTALVKHFYRISLPRHVVEIPAAPDVRTSVQHDAPINEKFFVDLDQKPGTQSIKIGIKGNYYDTYQYEFEIRQDGTVTPIPH